MQDAARSFARALEIVREIDNSYRRAEVLIKVASSQAEAGYIHDAAETAVRTELDNVSGWVFDNLMTTLVEHATN